MSGLEANHPSPEYLQVLRDHIHSPLEEAVQRAQEEQKELTVEMEALREFAGRVHDIDSVESRVRSLPLDNRPESDALERILTAYRETVYTLPHYDSRYDETVSESLRMEFGDDIANVLTSSTFFVTPIFKHRFLEEIERSIAKRQDIREEVDNEIESLRSAQSRLEEILDHINPSRFPLCPKTSVTNQLDSLVSRRQRVIHSHSKIDAVEGPNLCDYLYIDKPWTYPVLVAVCRLREAAIKGDSGYSGEGGAP
jgi:hypothetical protein